MTEEERVHFYETQLLAEEENRKKKEELLTQFLKDKLAKEEKANEFNKLKLQNQWRAIMREGNSQGHMISVITCFGVKCCNHEYVSYLDAYRA